jgi:hypothetical protein
MSQKPAATAIQARFPGPEFEQIQDWRRRQAKIPPLAEAVRTLVKRGLGVPASESVEIKAGRDRAAAATAE